MPSARALAAAAALALAACATAPTPPPDPNKIALPLEQLMTPPAEQIAIPPPACEGDPVCRSAEYYAPHRAQCGGFRDVQIGLQAYVNALHGRAQKRSTTP